MSLAPAGLVILVIAIAGASLALAAFLWAVRRKQFTESHLHQGAEVIFDSVEKVGTPTDLVFQHPGPTPDEQLDDGNSGKT